MKIPRLAVPLLALAMTLGLAAPALAADEAAAGPGKDPLHALAAIVLVFFVSIAVGCALAVLRVVLPGLARAADASLEGLGTARLFLMGVLPLIGAILLAQGAHALGLPALVWVVGLGVALPVALLLLLGALAAVPHLGGRLLASSAGERSLLVRASVGGLALGLAGVTWLLPPLGALVTLLVAGWFLGAGLGTLFRHREVAAGSP
jgi:hypothetical protein